ncbi:hypothetical protein PFISCL1PPCAC_11562, partial [Pristionchus fissidentatus]
EEGDQEEGKFAVNTETRRSRRHSSAPMKCVECEDYATFKVATYINHLRSKHGKTPLQAGVAFQCACGDVRRSQRHFAHGECHNVSVSIVRDEQSGNENVDVEDTAGGESGEETPANRQYASVDQDEMADRVEEDTAAVPVDISAAPLGTPLPEEETEEKGRGKRIRRIRTPYRDEEEEDGVNTSPSTWSCHLCEEYSTHSVGGYRMHLFSKHHTNFTEMGISFRCSCGYESQGIAHFLPGKCPGAANVTVVRDGENTVEMKDTVARKKVDQPVKAQLKRVKQELMGDEMPDLENDAEDYEATEGQHKGVKQDDGMTDDAMPDISRPFTAQLPPPTRKRSRRARNSLGELEERAEESSTELRCLLCDEYGTYSICGYVQHLKIKHHTSPTEAGIWFRCSCGHETRTNTHFLPDQCRGASVTVIRKDVENVEMSETPLKSQLRRVKQEPSGEGMMGRDNVKLKWPMTDDEEEEEGVDEKPVIKKRKYTKKELSTTVMKCVECENFESFNVAMLVRHLRKRHGKTPRQAGIAFHCECGDVSRSTKHYSTGACHGVAITIVREHERGEEEDEDEESKASFVVRDGERGEEEHEEE